MPQLPARPDFGQPARRRFLPQLGSRGLFLGGYRRPCGQRRGGRRRFPSGRRNSASGAVCCGGLPRAGSRRAERPLGHRRGRPGPAAGQSLVGGGHVGQRRAPRSLPPARRAGPAQSCRVPRLRHAGSPHAGPRVACGRRAGCWVRRSGGVGVVKVATVLRRVARAMALLALHRGRLETRTVWRHMLPDSLPDSDGIGDGGALGDAAGDAGARAG